MYGYMVQRSDCILQVSKSQDQLKHSSGRIDKVKKLLKKANRLIEREGVRLIEEDGADMQTAMADNSDKIDDVFAKDSGSAEKVQCFERHTENEVAPTTHTLEGSSTWTTHTLKGHPPGCIFCPLCMINTTQARVFLKSC